MKTRVGKPAKPFSSTGARIGHLSLVNGPSCTWRTPSSRIAGSSWSGPNLLQTHERLFDARAQAFRVLGGVPQRGIFDNMRSAVDRIGSDKARQINARFAAMASHYLFETEFCNPASGWEKGEVEKNVQDAPNLQTLTFKVSIAS